MGKDIEPPRMDRREFLCLAGLGAATLLTAGMSKKTRDEITVAQEKLETDIYRLRKLENANSRNSQFQQSDKELNGHLSQLIVSGVKYNALSYTSIVLLTTFLVMSVYTLKERAEKTTGRFTERK